jgi:hypothetical protein
LLNRAPILIVEDEPYIALELQTSVEDAGGEVVGPAGSVSAALAGRDLLEIVDDRHGRGSTIVTSQLPVDHWHEMIVDPTIADAVLDRLVHTAHRLALDGETLRKPPEKSGKCGKLDTDTAE